MNRDPAYERRRRAIVLSVIVTGVGFLIADAAGGRTELRKSFATWDIAAPVTNFIYFVGGLIAFAVLSWIVVRWYELRDATDSRPFRSWRKKRVIAVLALWLLLAYPASRVGFAYLAGRRLISPAAISAISPVYVPLFTVIIDPTGQPRTGTGWFLDLLIAARSAGERHAF